MHAAGADSLLLGTLEDIAWLTNLRGSDIACTPVFTSYLLVTDEDVTLYVDPKKIQTDDVKKHLKTNGISVVAYSDRRAHIAQLLNGHRVLLDADAVNPRRLRPFGAGRFRLCCGRRASHGAVKKPQKQG